MAERTLLEAFRDKKQIFGENFDHILMNKAY
jgi:hypothetical protein